MAQDSDENRWGTIFMGPTSDRESSIDKVTDSRQRDLWNRRTEAEYMERVRAKATLRVQTMIDQARANAEALRNTARMWVDKVKRDCDAMQEQSEKIRAEAESLRAEAESIRDAAYSEGYKIGMEQAYMELDEHRTALDDTTASVLKTIESQSATLFASWREELADLTRAAVETMTSWVLSEERAAILDALLHNALQQLEDRRRIVVRVNGLDCEAVTGVIATARERYPELQHWDVQADETIQPGGLLVESDSGMVDSRFELRREAVEQVLQHLVLPRGAGDEAAEAEIADVMEVTGVTAMAADADARAAKAEREAQAEADAKAEAEELVRQEEARKLEEHEQAEQENLEEGTTPRALTDGSVAEEMADAEGGAAAQSGADAAQDDRSQHDELALPEGQGDADAAASVDAGAVAVNAGVDAVAVNAGAAARVDAVADAGAPVVEMAVASAVTSLVEPVATTGEKAGSPDENGGMDDAVDATVSVADLSLDDDIPVLHITVDDADPALDSDGDPKKTGGGHGA